MRDGLGFLAGGLLVASSAVHVLLGWPAIRGELQKAGASSDLVTGVSIEWHFGGVAMFALGCLVILLFAEARGGRAVSRRPAQLIAMAYIGFSIWALTISHLDPFFLVFLVPGLLLAVASWPARKAS